MSTEGGDPRDESHSTGPDGAPGDSGVRADLSALDGPRVRTRPGRRRFIGRDLTSGSVPKNLWYLAWPQTVEGVFNALDQMADLFWAAKVAGFQAIGGVGVAQAFAHLIMMARMGLDVAMQSMVARAVGARQIDLASRIAIQSVVMTVLVSLVLMSVGIGLTSTLLSIVAVSDEVIAITVVYLQLQFVGTAVQGFRQSTGSALQASGDALTPMKATLLARGVHLALSPVMIFGWLGFPEMGIPGAAMANIVAQAVGAVWNIYALFTGTSRLQLSLRGFSPDFAIIWRQIKIAVPASGTQLERGLSELVLVRVVAPFGDIALSAYALTRRLERLTHIGSMGLGRASGILVGQNLGANLPERARSTVRWAMAYVFAIRGSAGVILFLFPAFWVGIFNDNPEFVAVAIVWIQIQAIGGMFMGGGQVMQQSFNVAGDTLAPLLVTFMSMWVLEVPVAILLTRDFATVGQYGPLGQYGIPIAIGLAMFGRLALYTLYFRTGRWLNVQVLDRAH